MSVQSTTQQDAARQEFRLHPGIDVVLAWFISHPIRNTSLKKRGWAKWAMVG
ncbi:MAG: hypothetical protein ACRD4S_00585 [Candidatus Acidiferrales bacterium]